MSGNLDPGSDFKPKGSVATFAAEVVAPSALSGVVKDKVVVVALDEIPANAAALTARIFSLIP